MNKQLQRKLAQWGFSVVRVLSHLPMWVHYRFADILYPLIYYVVRYRRDVVRRNLTDSFPEKSLKDIKKTERKFYRWFCDYIVETFKMATISREEMSRRMTFRGTEAIDRLVEKGISCGVMLGHYCNWEWISTLPLAVSPKGLCAELYHPLENPETNEFFLQLRQRFGSVCIPMEKALREIVRYREEKRPLVIGYIADQKPHWGNIHLWMDFLHHETPVLTGSERIIKRTGQAFFYLDVRRLRRGYYECEFKLINETPQDVPDFKLSKCYMRELEKTIRREPAYWLWSHNRWSRTKEEFDFRFRVSNGKVHAVADDVEWEAYKRRQQQQENTENQ